MDLCKWYWSSRLCGLLIKDVIEKRNHPHKSLREREIVLDPPWEDTALLHPRDCLLFPNQALLLFHTSKKRNTLPTIKIWEQNLELVKPNDAKETNVVSLCLKWASLSCAWFPSLNTFAICYLAARWWSTFQFCQICKLPSSDKNVVHRSIFKSCFILSKLIPA